MDGQVNLENHYLPPNPDTNNSTVGYVIGEIPSNVIMTSTLR